MAQKEALKVIVIGAGSTGLLLAQGLKQVRACPNLSPPSMANEPVR
jgi:cation diffusion facilitator CzcD-associated flavoprotein CzcO